MTKSKHTSLDKKSKNIELKKNYIRYKNIIKNMRDGVAIFKPTPDKKDFIFVELNPAGERTDKIKRKDVIGKRVTKVFPGIQKLGLLKIFKKVLRTGQPSHQPSAFYQDKRISGWRENYIYKISTGEIVAIYRDVTNKIEQQKKLQESEEKMSKLIESFVDPIFIHDKNGKIVGANKAACKSLGYTKNNLLNKNITDIDIDFTSSKLKKLLSLAKPGIPFFTTGTQQRKNGSTLQVEVHSILLQFKDQELFVSTTQNVSERLNYIAKIESQAKKLQSQVELLKSSQDTILNISKKLPVFIYNFSPKNKCLEIFSDKQWRKWTGQSIQNICVDQLYLLSTSIHPDDKEKILDLYKKSFLKKSIFKCSYRIINEINQKIFYVDHYIIPKKNTQGAIVKIDGIIVDVTNITASQKSTLRRLKFEEIIQQISSNFANLPIQKTNSAIKNALKLVSKFLHVQHAQLVMINKDKQSFTIKFHWDQKNGNSVYKKTNTLNFKDYSEVIQLIKTTESVFIKDIGQLKNTLSLEKKIWKKAGVRSIIIIPLIQNRLRVGFIQFLSTREMKEITADNITMLITISSILSSALIRLASYEKEKDQEKQLQKSLLGTIQAIGLTIERRDPYTAGHQQRVAQLAVAIAKKLKLPEEEIEGIRLGSLIHDIGKIHIPNEILSRPGHISDAEMDLIRTHPQVGYDIIKHINFPWPIAEMVLNHHERLNGSGYPNQLKGKEISLNVRILSVSDVVEAMCSHRPYRPAKNLEEALLEIKQHKGTLYDQDVVQACLDVFKKDHFEFHERDVHHTAYEE